MASQMVRSRKQSCMCAQTLSWNVAGEKEPGWETHNVLMWMSYSRYNENFGLKSILAWMPAKWAWNASEIAERSWEVRCLAMYEQNLGHDSNQSLSDMEGSDMASEARWGRLPEWAEPEKSTNREAR